MNCSLLCNSSHLFKYPAKLGNLHMYFQLQHSETGQPRGLNSHTLLLWWRINLADSTPASQLNPRGGGRAGDGWRLVKTLGWWSVGWGGGGGVVAWALGVSKCVTEHFVMEPITTHGNPTRADKGFYQPPWRCSAVGRLNPVREKREEMRRVSCLPVSPPCPAPCLQEMTSSASCDRSSTRRSAVIIWPCHSLPASAIWNPLIVHQQRSASRCLL